VPPIRVWVLRDPRPPMEYNFDYYGAGRRKRWLHSLSLISAVSCLLLATLSPSGGRAWSFSIERAPQINLKRWPPLLLAHPLRWAPRLEGPLWGELLYGNPRRASRIGAT
jgi:hypothetical protein